MEADFGKAMKITGAAAGKKYSFDQCVRIGRAVNAQVVSIGSALDHCHVPGRQGNEPIPHDIAIVGAGIHNEPVSCQSRSTYVARQGVRY